MRKLFVRESGVVLPMAMIMLLAGSILVVPLLMTVSTGSLIAKHASFAETEDYAGDAGVEDAIWELLYNNLGASIPNTFPDPNNHIHYVLGPVNGETVNLRVEYLGTAIATDDFETHTWSGGSGWAGNWSVTSLTEITGAGVPFQGTHHVRIRAAGGSGTRTVDLSGQPSNVRFQFWAKVKGFELGDTTELRFSPDGSTWSVAKIWTNADSDDIYYYHDIDLTAYTLSNQFRISFVADITNGGDKFYFDDIRIIGPPRYKIDSDVGGSITTVEVSIDGGQATILSWKQT